MLTPRIDQYLRGHAAAGRFLRTVSLLAAALAAVASQAARGQSPPPVSARLPASLLECEGDQCTRGGGGGLWVFEGTRGEAMWRYGAVAELTVERFDGYTIVLDRADPPGTYSSRWAGPDGYFRARYSGTLRGNRIDGTVFFNGDTTHPGTWYATVSETPCGIGATCPLTIDQVRLLGRRSAEARLQQAAALCARIAGSSAQAGGPVPPDAPAICNSSNIRGAMQVLEDEEVQSAGGALLGAAACAFTGVCGDAEHPENLHPTVLRSRFTTDGAGYTANDPGSFLCQGLFARGDVHLKVGENGDLASELTAEQMTLLLKQFPNFQENYKVRPLGSGRFLLILIPALTGLTPTYSTRFTYP